MHPVDGREFFSSEQARRGDLAASWGCLECMRVNNPKSEAR